MRERWWWIGGGSVAVIGVGAGAYWLGRKRGLSLAQTATQTIKETVQGAAAARTVPMTEAAVAVTKTVPITVTVPATRPAKTVTRTVDITRTVAIPQTATRTPIPGVQSVNFKGAGKDLKITITGYGFGSFPYSLPYNGDVPGQFYFSTIGSNDQEWSAGDGGTAVTLRYQSWSNTQIVINGFGGLYGQNGWVVVPGKAFTIGGNNLSRTFSGTLPITSTDTTTNTITGNVPARNSSNSEQITTQFAYIKDRGKVIKVYLTPAQTQVGAEQQAALQNALNSTNPEVRYQAQQYIASTQSGENQLASQYAMQNGSGS